MYERWFARRAQRVRSDLSGTGPPSRLSILLNLHGRTPMSGTRTFLVLSVLCLLIGVASAAIAKPRKSVVPAFHDTFDTAASLDRYELRPGVWYEAPPPPDGVVTVEHFRDDGDGVLLFHDTFSAVRLDREFALRYGADNRVSFDVDPAIFDTESLTWTSMILTTDPEALGWVTDPGNELGLLIRSNGDVALFTHHGDVPLAWESGPPTPTGTYRVALIIAVDETADGLTATVSGTVNSAAFTANPFDLPAGAVTAPVYLVLGTHYHEDGSLKFSWVDDLKVSL